MSSEENGWEKDILGWASSDFDSLELPLIGKNCWIVHREILHPDQIFFFTTMFDWEQEWCSSWQPCKWCRSSTRAQESENIWDLLESGLGQGSTSWTMRKASNRKIEAGHRTSLLQMNFFSTHLYLNGSSGLRNFQDSRYDYLLCFIFGYGKIIWGAFDAALRRLQS